MTITNALAGLAATDLEASIRWYSDLFGREPDSRPMPEAAEWAFPSGGWLQLFEDRERAGAGSVTLAETHLDARVRTLRANGVEIGPTSASDYVKTAIITDPDGNRIVFAEAVSPENRAAS